MNRVTRNGLIAAAAASGALAVTMPAHADSGADGTAAGSPGLISGNTIQLPVHVPVNVCGNTVNVAGLLNPAAGNSCANKSGAAGEPGGTRGGAVAHGSGKDSPGVLSGNDVQLPVHAPVNVSGNSVTVVGLGNAAIGNESTNTSGVPQHPVGPAPTPSAPTKAYPRPQAPRHAPQQTVASLAHTGADQTLPAIAGSAALVLGGVALYRRFRPAAVR
ncbi:chaplin [Streptomyces sp. R41]|uniref:Chaplin n=1 Tax=Streptomyces sp. R41 TaxID=3238632 RepID=A0AB39R852_9ACTN